MSSQISPKEWQNLSDYVDGQLSPAERVRVEKTVNANPQLRSALEDLRTTRAMLRSMPQRRAPRNFTLTPEMVGKPRRASFRFAPTFTFASALASLLLVLTFVGQSLSHPAATMVAEAPAPAMAEKSFAQAQDTGQNPVIVTWGTPTPEGFGQAMGMGGGGDGGVGGGPAAAAPVLPEMGTSGGETTVMGQGGEGLLPETATSEPIPMVEAPALAQKLPDATQAPALSQPLATQESPAQEQANSNPILGLPEAGTAGEVLSTQPPTASPATRTAAQPFVNFGLIEILLGALAVASAVAAFFFHRKETL